MPTAAPGPWLETAIAKGLIRPQQLLPRTAQSPVAVMAAELPADLSEKAFQSEVIKLAEANGYSVYHTHNSRRSAKGWPDLALCRTGRLLLVELKTDMGKLRPEQAEWLDLLRTVTGIEVYVWRPMDWPLIRQELTRAGA